MVQNVFGALLLGAGLATVAGGLFIAQRGRRWHATLDRFDEPATVDALEPGSVAVVGTVRAADDTDPVTGPLSGEEGVVVESRVTRGSRGALVGSRRRVRVLDRHADWTPFEVDDGTGRVRVELPDEPDSDGWSLQSADWLAGRRLWGLDFDLVEETGRAGVSWGVPDADRFGELHAPFDTRFGPDEVPPGERRRYAERVVRPGDEVLVFGEATRTGSWDGPDWTITADDPETFLLSDRFAAPEEREAARRERTQSRLLGYALGGFAVLFGLLVTAASVFFTPDPLRAVLYLLAGVPVLAVGALAVRRCYRYVPSVSFLARSLGSGGAIGAGLLGAGAYLLARRPAGTLVAADAWPAYLLLLAAGAVFLWSAVSALLYVQYGVDLPLRGKLPGDD